MIVKTAKKPKPRDPNWRWLRALKPKVKTDGKKYDRKKPPMALTR